MIPWQESVYSDGTALFISDPAPAVGETVSVRLRVYADAPVRTVRLRYLRNGLEQVVPARRIKTERGLAWYEARMPVTEARMRYRFYLLTEEGLYFYNQAGLSRSMPASIHDFALLADYVQPAWVKDAVFYQIFPERFCNGDPANDVRPGEYALQGHPTLHMDWDETPPAYETGRCLDFFGGDLEGIRQKIPYLKDLGVTALYINPIFRAPSTHKYDCVDYFHVDPHFGGDEALAALSRQLHQNGMRLILDISINHTGADHRWFNRDGLFFPAAEGAFPDPGAPERAYYFFGEGNSYHAWAGVEDLPTLNYTSQALRDAIYRSGESVLKKWLKPPYSIDGWRFDVADTFARNDEVQLSHALWPEIRRSIREEDPQAYILAEDWEDCAEYLQGDEWDAPMNYYGCGRPIRQFLGQPDLFLSRDEALREASRGLRAENLARRIVQYLAQIPYALQENQFNLFDSHDTSRLHNDPDISPMAWRGAVYFQFILPGAPCIYYGDEAAIGGTLGSNEGCRYPMPWDSGFETGDSYRVYRTMARLKAAHSALSRGGMQILYALGDVIALARSDGEEAFAAVISVSDREERVRLPLGAVGACGLESTDVMGEPLAWRALDERAVELTIPAGTSYFVRCVMKDK